MGCWRRHASGHVRFHSRASLEAGKGHHASAYPFAELPPERKGAEYQQDTCRDARKLSMPDPPKAPCQRTNRKQSGPFEFTPRAWGKHAKPARANANQRVLACGIAQSGLRAPCRKPRPSGKPHIACGLQCTEHARQRTCPRRNESPDVGRDIEERARHGLVAVTASAGPTSPKSHTGCLHQH